MAGIVKDRANVSQYQSLGGLLNWNTPQEPWWASKFYLELNKVYGDDLNGYNIGLGFSLDY